MEYFEAGIWTWLGLVTGSFVNVCIDRLPLQFADKEHRSSLLNSSETSLLLKKHIRDQSLTLINPARSFCFSCGHQLCWFENIPVLSYIISKGRCRICSSALGSRIFWTETIHGLCYGIFGWILQNWIWSLFVSINFSFFWILAYCRSYQQLRIKLYYAGGVLMALNFMGYFFIRG